MKSKKAQISIEFLIVFAFVLLVFLFLFSLITQQRAVIQNTQTYSQLQLIAQNIALQISRAALSQSGYSAQLPLLTSVGVTPYNLSITSSGTVIVTSTTAKQAVRATAFSSARGISSNPAYLAAGSNTVYNIPISNGTISIQNSYGTICIDYSCQASANQTSLISLSTQIVHPGLFNGGSALGGSDVSALQSNTGLGFSFSAWVYPTNTTTSRGITQGDSYVFRIDSPSEGNKLSWFVYIGGAIEPRLSSTAPLSLNKWYHVVGTYNSSTGYMGLYINGALNSSETRAGSPTLGYCGCFNIGVGSSSDWVGMITNAQLYHFGLSANQVKALYANGISAAPINTSYLGGWWPISGNANDYSGNGDNLATGTILFPTTAQIYASVKNPLGKAVNNLLLGFATTIGNFTNGKGGPAQVVSTYTNLNGVASVFLNQQGNNGQALVKATAFNSNVLPEASLVAWYPLNLGQGNVEYDLSGNKNNGAFVGQPGWNIQNYYAQFPSPQISGVPYSPSGIFGQTGYVEQKTGFVFMDNAAQPFTISLWVRPNATSGVILSELGQSTPNTNWHDSWLELVNGNVYMRVWSLGCQLLGKINNNTWTNIEMTFNGAVLTGYINGVSTNAISYTRQVPAGGTTAMFYPLGVPDLTNCGSGLSYSGGVANYQFYSNSLSQAQVFSLYSSGLSGPPVPNQNLQLWYPLSGDSNDYGSNGNNGTMYGAVSFTPLSPSAASQVSSGNPGRVLVGSFNSLGNSASYVTISSNKPDFNALSQISITAWVNLTNANTQGAIVEDSGEYYLVARTIGGVPYLAAYFYGVAPAGYYISGGPLPINQLTHVGVTYNGANVVLYMNGVASNSVAVTGNLILSGTPYLQLGGEQSVDRFFPGIISNAQIYKSALSSAQMTQLYNEGLSGQPIPGTNVLAWWPLEGNANDYSYGGNNGTATNVVYKNTINYIPSLLQSSNYSGVNFNGQTSYITTPHSNFPTGSSARSLFAWVYFNSVTGGCCNNPTISFFGTEVATQASILALSNGKLIFGGWSDDYLSSLQVTPGTWHLVGYTYSAGATSVTLWVDGKSQTGSLNGGSALNTVLSGNTDIGVRYDCLGSCTEMNGTVADLQIYNYNLTITQVQQLYNSGIPPSATTPIPLSWYP